MNTKYSVCFSIWMLAAFAVAGRAGRGEDVSPLPSAGSDTVVVTSAPDPTSGVIIDIGPTTVSDDFFKKPPGGPINWDEMPVCYPQWPAASREISKPPPRPVSTPVPPVAVSTATWDWRRAAAGALAGLLVGLALAALIFRLRRRPR